jgi:hypothetical protein
MLILAVLETGGVVSLMPFLAVLGNPASIEKHAPLKWMYTRGGFHSVKDFLFGLGLGAFVIV